MDDQDPLVTLARRLGSAAAANGITVVTAESCTGGLVAAAITAVAGSSGWFERGFVTYSNEAKCELLGVPESTLAAHGAVSVETAGAMAEGALRRSRAQVAVSITGIAGPAGATPGKPVGTVCIGLARVGEPTLAERFQFPGDRARVRADSASEALRRLIMAVTARPGAPP